METTVKDIATHARRMLDDAVSVIGSKSALYFHLQEQYGISQFTVRNFHNGEKDNPTQNMLDSLIRALKDMARKAA